MIALNITANVFGLGNAATPFGIKAMEELQKLNPSDDTAHQSDGDVTRDQHRKCPARPACAAVWRCWAFRSTSSSSPIIIATSLELIGRDRRGEAVREASERASVRFPTVDLSALESRSVNVFFAKCSPCYRSSWCLRSWWASLYTASSSASPSLRNLRRGRQKKGFAVAVRIIPYLVAILFAIAMFRASGAMDFLVRVLDPVLSPLGFPGEVLPMAIIRPLTGSGSAGLVVDMVARYGEDSILVKMAAVMFRIERKLRFYVIAVYFGAINIKRTRHAISAGLTADVSAALLSVWIVRLFYG